MDINYYKKYEPIDGKWYITKELGNGAFGTVFEIERRDFTNDKSALKIITIPSSPNDVRSYREENYDLDEKSISSYFYGFVEEFTKEFALMTKLKGQNNVVRIEDYDVKEHEDEVGWDIFIRMELLTPMNKHFAKNAPKTRDVIKLGIDICKALEVCQKFNIVHRDIKPSNIFVSDAGEYKLGDFGVARTLEKTSSGLSKKGTYTYMAPEVYKGEAYGSNVDIYSLGIVMYKLLNNNMEPYKQGRTHEDDEKALVARLKGEPMHKPANADGRLAEIILKACAFNPKERYESPLQMREELENILWSETEEKIIYPEGEVLEFVPSDVPESEEPDTSGIFDENPKKDLVEDDGPTRGIFDEHIREKTLNKDKEQHSLASHDNINKQQEPINMKLLWKGIIAVAVALVIIVAVVATSMMDFEEPKTNSIFDEIPQKEINKYNKLGYVDISGKTIQDIADEQGMTLTEWLEAYKLPADMPGDTIEAAAYYMIPTGVIAEMNGLDFATLKTMLKLPETATAETPWGEAEGGILLADYIGGTDNVDAFKAQYGLGDEVTAETPWGEIRNTVDTIAKEQREAE